MANHNETVVRVYEYKLDMSKPFNGETPAGKVIKEFTGRTAVVKAGEYRDKLNEKETSRMLKGGDTSEIKGYYVKGNLAVESRVRA